MRQGHHEGREHTQVLIRHPPCLRGWGRVCVGRRMSFESRVLCMRRGRFAAGRLHWTLWHTGRWQRGHSLHENATIAHAIHLLFCALRPTNCDMSPCPWQGRHPTTDSGHSSVHPRQPRPNTLTVMPSHFPRRYQGCITGEPNASPTFCFSKGYKPPSSTFCSASTTPKG